MELFKILGYLAIVILFIIAIILWLRWDKLSLRFYSKITDLDILINQLEVNKENYDFIYSEFSEMICTNDKEKKVNLELYMKFRFKYNSIVKFDYDESRTR